MIANSLKARMFGLTHFHDTQTAVLEFWLEFNLLHPFLLVSNLKCMREIVFFILFQVVTLDLM